MDSLGMEIAAPQVPFSSFRFLPASTWIDLSTWINSLEYNWVTWIESDGFPIGMLLAQTAPWWELEGIPPLAVQPWGRVQGLLVDRAR